MLSERASVTPSNCNALAGKFLQFQETRASSVTLILNSDDSNMGSIVGYMLWHRKADDKDYPSEPTSRLFAPDTKLLLSNLSPATDYFLKVAAVDKDREIGFNEFQFRTERSEQDMQKLNSKNLKVERSESPATNCSSLSNPSSVEDENNTVLPCRNEDDDRGDNYLRFTGNADKTAASDLLVNDNDCSDPSAKEDNGSGDIISLLDEEHSCMPNSDAVNFRNKEKESSTGQVVEETSTDNGSNTPPTGLKCVPYVESSEAFLQITPCKIDNVKDGGVRRKRSKNNGKGIDIVSKRDEEPQAGSSSKKRSGERRDEDCPGIGDKDFEYYVKVVRWLECDGHIETAFRQKFLTWYSLRATPQEVRIVKVFIDTFIEDPASLAGQLVDTFNDVMSNKRCSRVRSGFCMKLWH